MPTAKKAKRKDASQAMADRLVDAALDLIEQNGGCRGVSLRKIATRAKCAHTNAYNYFNSLEDLFWATVGRTLERLLKHSAEALQSPAGKKAPLRTLLKSQATYTQQHPSHYRLFWLEPLAGRPPANALRSLEEMRGLWVRIIASQTKAPLSEANLIWAGQIVHGYFHGEMGKLIGRTAFITTSPAISDRIVNNTLALVEMIGATRR